ncbi:MAG: flagellar basal body-associated FliL family protein [Pseudobdellovibrio sp.]
MSDNSPQDQDPKPDLNPEEAEMALADIDSLIAEEDPEFLAKMGTIKIDSQQVAGSFDGSIDIDTHIKHSLRIYVKRPFEFRTNTRNVAIFWVVVLVAIVSILFAWQSKMNLFQQDLFLTNLEKLGSGKVQDYNPNTDTEAFYDNPRFAKNLISISPVHANLKPSESSGENPMLAFEVTVEGLSADAIIEIKDRQAEFKDLLARLTEEKTYDELVAAEGKRVLCDQYRDLLNANLTRGQVRRVLLKTFIIKP